MSSTVLLVLPACMLPFFVGQNTLQIITLAGIYAIAAQGLNLLVGFNGQISFCQGALFGLGFYTTAFCMQGLGLPIWLSLPLAGVTAAAVGMIFALPSRFGTLPLALATMLAHLVISRALVLWVGKGNPPPFQAAVLSANVSYFMVLALLLLSILALHSLLATRHGRAMLAVRQDSLRAALLGIRPSAVRALAFSVCCFHAGVAGGLLSLTPGGMIQHNYGLQTMAALLFIVIAGGMGRLSGPLLGAGLALALSVGISYVYGRPLANLDLGAGQLPEGVGSGLWGLLILLFILFSSGGLAAFIDHLYERWRAWPFPPEVIRNGNPGR